jgi:hypothetical protein
MSKGSHRRPTLIPPDQERKQYERVGFHVPKATPCGACGAKSLRVRLTPTGKVTSCARCGQVQQ